MATKKAKILVVDTNAFIKGVRLETIGQEFYTIPQVSLFLFLFMLLISMHVFICFMRSVRTFSSLNIKPFVKVRYLLLYSSFYVKFLLIHI
jgi:hypothetical protein